MHISRFTSFYLFTGQLKLIVTLKGEAKDAHSIRAGIYNLGPNLVNGKLHWLQDSGSNAIWHDKKNGHWNIGQQSGLGGNRAWITTQQDAAGPLEATTWQYARTLKSLISMEFFLFFLRKNSQLHALLEPPRLLIFGEKSHLHDY